MICFWVRKQLIRYAEGNLGGLAGWLVGSHVLSCSSCASETEELKQMGLVYRRSAGPPLEPEASVWGSLEAVLLAETRPSRARKGAAWLRPAALAGAAACLVLGAFWLNIGTDNSPGQVATEGEALVQGVPGGQLQSLAGRMGKASSGTVSGTASVDSRPSAAAGPRPPRSRVRTEVASGKKTLGRTALASETKAMGESPLEVAAALDEPLPDSVESLGFDASGSMAAVGEAESVGDMDKANTYSSFSSTPPFMGEGPPSILLEPTTVAEMHHPDGIAMLGAASGDYPELDARSIEMIYSSPEERAKTIFNY